VGNWEASRADAIAIRHEVFVLEQGVPVEIELDSEDVFSLHAVAYGASGLAVGTGRLLRNAHIGRMAVLAAYRGQGVGAALLTALVSKSRELGHKEVVLSAQVHARKFYAAHGFVAEGDIYLDAGIEHITMRRIV
jgi:predicted GNAT family N-acyltransferase